MVDIQIEKANEQIYELNPLIDQGVVFIPSDFEPIDVWTFRSALRISSTYEERPIVLFNGMGGASGGAFAMSEFLRETNAIGVAYGEVISAHSIAWAACPERYIGSLSSLLVHGVRNSMYDAPTVEADHQTNVQSTRSANDILCGIYASACGNLTYTDTDYWKRLIRRIGMYSRTLTSQDVVDKYMMAKYVKDMPTEFKLRLGII